MHGRTPSWAAVITDGLAAWVLAAVVLGLLVPGLARLEPLVVPLLVVMVGSICLTLSVESFRAIRPDAFLRILLTHAAMGAIGYGIAWALGLSAAMTLGFVLLGAVTPELTSPLMTRISGGSVALSATVLLAAGLLSLLTVPGYAAWLGGDVAVDRTPLLVTLVVAVVLPMAVAVGVRHRWPRRVRRYDPVYPAVSALAVILVMAIVAAGSRDVVNTGGRRLLEAAVGVVLFLVAGAALGWVVCLGARRRDRVTSTFSVGMRDFAVAAALVTAAGLPAVAALPAVLYGFLEMVASPLVARGFIAASHRPEP